MNKIVDRSRFTPALVPPVATVSVKHLGEIANSCHARPREGRADVGVTPHATAVSGFKNIVGVLVREATAAFVHTCDIYRSAARQVARDLHVADKRTAVDYCCRTAPRGASISGVDAHESALADIKIVPGNVQSP